MEFEKNTFHDPETAKRVAPEIRQTAEKHRSFAEALRTSKTAKMLGGAVAAGMIGAGVYASSERAGDIEPVDFSSAEEVDETEDGSTIIESPDGTRYQGVWLDGETGSSWTDLGLSAKERQQVLKQNGLDTIPNEPTTVFVETNLLHED